MSKHETLHTESNPMSSQREKWAEAFSKKAVIHPNDEKNKLSKITRKLEKNM